MATVSPDGPEGSYQPRAMERFQAITPTFDWRHIKLNTYVLNCEMHHYTQELINLVSTYLA